MCLMLTSLQFLKSPLKPLEKCGFPSVTASLLGKTLAEARGYLLHSVVYLIQTGICPVCSCESSPGLLVQVFFPFFSISTSATTSSHKTLFQCAHYRERFQLRKHPSCLPSEPGGCTCPSYALSVNILSATVRTQG